MSRSENGAADFRDLVAEIVRRSLDAGQAVEIEGLGKFRLSSQAGALRPNRYEFTPERGAEVFVAYAAEDLPLARKLCDGLRAHGCSPWLDKEQLLPGQNWPRAIERAINIADAFIACFSPRSIAKRGQFQCELRYALDCARKRPLEEAFVIPVRIEPCPVPSKLADQVQYVDLFPEWEKGVGLVARAARSAARQKPMPRLQ
jgi:hypothetical protein